MAKSRELAKRIGRMIPVRKPNVVHRSITDYDRRDSKSVIEEALSEMDEEDDMKNYTRVKAVAEEIFTFMACKGVNAVSYPEDTEPPVIKVYGITDEILEITVDVKGDDK